MFLLLESGATKLHYVLADTQRVYHSGRLAGLHPFISTSTNWQDQLRAIAKAITPFPPPTHCYYYGTGCGTSQGRAQVHTYLTEHWPAVQLAVADDLLAAARSLCGQRVGLVGILGTGSNAAYYDGRQLAAQAGGLGYLLGDEGGGASLGRILLQAFFQKRLPAALSRDLAATYQLDPETLFPALYGGDAPSRLLASFAPWLHDHRHHPFVETLVREDFTRFTTYYLLPLAAHYPPTPVALTGSIAQHFRTILLDVIRTAGLGEAEVVADPAAGLVAYHQETY